MYDKLRLINRALDRRFPNGRDVLLCALQIAAYYEAEHELEEAVNTSVEHTRSEGLLD